MEKRERNRLGKRQWVFGHKDKQRDKQMDRKINRKTIR
jgi:hypothetical protein